MGLISLKPVLHENSIEGNILRSSKMLVFCNFLFLIKSVLKGIFPKS